MVQVPASYWSAGNKKRNVTFLCHFRPRNFASTFTITSYFGYHSFYYPGLIHFWKPDVCPAIPEQYPPSLLHFLFRVAVLTGAQSAVNSIALIGPLVVHAFNYVGGQRPQLSPSMGVFWLSTRHPVIPNSQHCCGYRLRSYTACAPFPLSSRSSQRF